MPKRRLVRTKPKRSRPSGGWRRMRLGTLARKAWKGVQFIKGLVNSELLKLDVTGFQTPLTSGLVTNLVPITQGDSDSGRTGNSVFVRSLNGRITLNRDTAGLAPNAQMVRISVVLDTQQVGDTSPTFTTIYENNNILSHLNSDTVGRFKVLHSKIYKVDADDPKRYLEINLPMRHHVRYNGSASTDIQKGGLYMVAVGDDGTYGPTLTYEWRCAYHDN